MPSAVPISMQTGTENVFVGSQPTCFEAITRRKSGITGISAMMGLILKFSISRSVSVSSFTEPTPSFSIMEIAARMSAAIRIPSAAGSAS
ncbi:unknown [Sutterella sp. CAG:351]|nr:unknown [Sutterella sp. CAG:351]